MNSCPEHEYHKRDEAWPNCATCGKDASKSPVILIDDRLYRVHLGLCSAKLYLAYPKLAERNELSVEFLKNYVATHQNMPIINGS
jgi:hypothetical protein